MGKLAALPDGSARVVDAEQPTGDEMAAILERVAASARSARGMATALADVMRVLRHCAWLGGNLRMELAGDAEAVAVHVYADQGAVRERVLRPVMLAVSLDELDVALQGMAGLFAPLRMRHHEGRLIFTST
jgi:hypothetical protein